MKKFISLCCVWLFLGLSVCCFGQDNSDALSSNEDINQLAKQAISQQTAFRNTKHTDIPLWAEITILPIVGLFLLWMLWLTCNYCWQFMTFILRRNWLPCDAEITGRGMSYNEKQKRFQTFVVYEYQIDNETIQQTILKTARTYKEAFANIKKYYIGEYLPVFINPNNPNSAALSLELNPLVVNAPFTLFVFYAVLFLATYPNKVGETIYNALIPISYNIPLFTIPGWMQPLCYMYVFALIGIKFVYREKKRESNYSASVTGVVIKSFVDHKRKPYPIVIYEYIVDGRKYINNIISEKIDKESSLPFDYAEQYCHKYAKGNEVTVHYDLHEPDISTLEKN